MEKAKNIRPMCGNCVHIQEWLKCSPHFCGYLTKDVDPYDTPCSFFSAWQNPKYVERKD